MGVTLILFPNVLLRGSMIALLVYTLETFVYFISGNVFYDSISNVITSYLMMGSALVLTDYVFTYDKDYSFTKQTLFTSISSLVAISIISIPILRVNPDIIRSVYSIHSLGDNEVTSVSSWLIGWNSVTGMTCIISTLVFLCKKIYSRNKKMFYFWVGSTTILYYIVFQSNIATPFVVCTIMVVIGLLFGDETFNRTNKAKIAIVGLLSALLMTPAILLPVLSFFQRFMPFGATYKRIDEIKDTLVFGEASADSDLGGRNELYSNSWDLFLESPFVGTFTPERIGYHSYFIDRLACHGLLFIIPLVIIFVVHFKYVYKRLNHTKVTYTFGFFALLFMLFIKSESFWLFGFFLLPNLCRYIDGIMDNKSSVVLRHR